MPTTAWQQDLIHPVETVGRAGDAAAQPDRRATVIHRTGAARLHHPDVDGSRCIGGAPAAQRMSMTVSGEVADWPRRSPQPAQPGVLGTRFWRLIALGCLPTCEARAATEAGRRPAASPEAALRKGSKWAFNFRGPPERTSTSPSGPEGRSPPERLYPSGARRIARLVARRALSFYLRLAHAHSLDVGTNRRLVQRRTDNQCSPRRARGIAQVFWRRGCGDRGPPWSIIHPNHAERSNAQGIWSFCSD